MTALPFFTLRGSVLAFALTCLAVVSAVGAGFVYLKGDRFTDSTLAYAARFRTNAAADELARTLERDWRDLVFLSRQAGTLDAQDLSYLMTGAGGDGSRISWVGYADLGGTVVAATDNLLVGKDVSERPWYRNGLTGGFAGDVHDAVLLAQLLGSGSDQPLRFIDLARPVVDANGDVTGVVGIHINADWLTGYLRDASKRFGIDLYLINPAGEVSAASTELQTGTSDLHILRAAQAGIVSEGRETWPDGRDYFSTLVPQVGYGDLPSFGWRMIGRLESDTLQFGVDLMRNGAHYAAMIALALLATLTLLYARFVLKPFSWLAASAKRISEGSQEYPANSRVTVEAALLSDALTHLQHDPVSADR